MPDKTHSPRILTIEWGKIEVEGLGIGKDLKLFPGGGREWDWNETGTRHVPGIQPADVEELVQMGSMIIVLSRGMQLVLQTCPETLSWLNSLSIPTIVEETKEAVAVYNKLVTEGNAVGGLFHSTC